MNISKEQLKNALECCMDRLCDLCPYMNSGDPDSCCCVLYDALELIRLQERKIERITNTHKKIQKIEVDSVIKENFLRCGGAMLIRVPYDVVPGQTVYSLIEPEYSDNNEWEIEDEMVTEVGSRGFFVSGCRPAEEDMAIFFPWSDVGVEVFFSREAAENKIKMRNAECRVQN